MNKDFEKAYYERDTIWEESYFQEEDLQRFEITTNKIPADVKKLVDIGCGNGLFLKNVSMVRTEIKLCAFDRSEEALKHIQQEKYCGDISSLPFSDDAFDMVTCLEVIEHLDWETFHATLSELARISKKYILITVPYDEDIEGVMVQCSSCKKKFHPSLHQRSFSKNTMVNLFQQYGYRQIENCLLGKQVEYVLITALKKKLFGNSGAEYCPYCGWKQEYHGTKNSEFKKVVQKYWPKRIKPSWMLSLYEKI